MRPSRRQAQTTCGAVRTVRISSPKLIIKRFQISSLRDNVQQGLDLRLSQSCLKPATGIGGWGMVGLLPLRIKLKIAVIRFTLRSLGQDFTEISFL
jgi:hypothetical protein